VEFVWGFYVMIEWGEDFWGLFLMDFVFDFL